MHLISSEYDLSNSWFEDDLLFFLITLDRNLIYSSSTYKIDLSALPDQWAFKPKLYQKLTYCLSGIYKPCELNKQFFFFPVVLFGKVHSTYLET